MTTEIEQAAIVQGHRELAARVFERACRDCEIGTQEDALDALLFLASQRAAIWAAYLIDSPVEAVEGGILQLAFYYWDRVRERFGIMLKDFDPH